MVSLGSYKNHCDKQQLTLLLFPGLDSLLTKNIFTILSVLPVQVCCNGYVRSEVNTQLQPNVWFLRKMHQF